MSNRIVVGVTGATGQIFAIRTLELIEDLEYESHLIVSSAAKVTIEHETDTTLSEIQSLADHVYAPGNIGAKPASGSFRTAGMIVTPCSMKTLSNIAHGNTGDLISRAGDVTLKERRPLVLLPRETPFNRIHLKNMLEVTDAGGIVVPPFPSYYQTSDGVDEQITRTVARALSLLDVHVPVDEWEGL